MAKFKYDINFYDLHDKAQNTRDMVEYNIDRIMSMFKWNNLPKTIPQRSLEMYLMFNGFVLLVKHNDEYCIYYGGLGGEPDYLYRPTIATIANPAQKWDAQLPIAWEVDEDTSTENDGVAVIGLNDTMLKGMLPILRKYASLISENELTLWITDILTRMPWVLSADNDKDKAAADEFIRNVFDGKLSAIQSSAFLEGLKEHILNNNNHQSLGALMQLHQYYKASLFNEIGLNAMQNQFKKEAISDSEENMNSDVLTPLIDIMLDCRKDFCDRVNALFGLDISVELNSAWKDNEIEEEAMLDEITNPEEGEELSENEVEDTQSEETTEEEELETEEEQTEEESEDTQEETDIQETLDNIEEKVDEILEEITEEEDTEDENSTT